MVNQGFNIYMKFMCIVITEILIVPVNPFIPTTPYVVLCQRIRINFLSSLLHLLQRNSI